MATKSKTAVIIGSGAGGSMAALALAQSGRFDRITVLEKGPNYYEGLDRPNFNEMTVAFSNDEIKFGQRAGAGTAPDSLDDPDLLLDPRSFRSSASVVREFVGDVQTLPQLVGGALTHADWKARRLRPADFRLKTLADQFGYDIAHSTTVDWPISYDDLEPFYALAEQIIGVQGPAQMPAPFAPRRSGPYPMPPGVPQYLALVVTAGAKRLGLSPYPAPTGITSRPYRGRPACNDCGFDDLPCAIGARGIPALTALRDALLTGKVSVRPDSHVFRLTMGNGGRAVESVAFLDEDGKTRELTADVFVLAASAIESARLCLLSGFSNPLIGANLMFHRQTTAIGIFAQQLHGHRGRTASFVWDDFAGPAEIADYKNFRSGGAPLPRGGTIEIAGGPPVIMEGQLYPFGVAHKQMMRQSSLREHLTNVTMQGEDLPQASNRVDLDPDLKDSHGFPVARITYAGHPYELNAAAHYQPIMVDVMNAAGALEAMAVTAAETSPIPGSRHIMGTLRMGNDPASSVTDANGKFHSVANLYAADGSVFPTSGPMNPSLTIMALGHRIGTLAARTV
jgi:choline dehydrogenase-like flavoprotein